MPNVISLEHRPSGCHVESESARHPGARFRFPLRIATVLGRADCARILA